MEGLREAHDTSLCVIILALEVRVVGEAHTFLDPRIPNVIPALLSSDPR